MKTDTIVIGQYVDEKTFRWGILMARPIIALFSFINDHCSGGGPGKDSHQYHGCFVDRAFRTIAFTQRQVYIRRCNDNRPGSKLNLGETEWITPVYQPFFLFLL